MKSVITILILIFLPVIGFAQTDSVIGSYELKGKLINQISLPPNCGFEAFGTVIEFEIITFSDTRYKSGSIGVIFTCPESYGNGFFKVGKTYIMTIVENNLSNFSWNIPNKSILKKYKLERDFIVFKAEKED